MKNNALSIRVTAWITSISFIVILIIHYGCYGAEADFWCNVFLAIFGSGLLTFISSCIGYATEKVRTMEGFTYSTHSLVHFINKYDVDWDSERKIDFFLDYDNVDKSLWDAQLGAIFFLRDPERDKSKYIYQKIYKPIQDLNEKVSEHEWHFRLYKDGSGKNEKVMVEFVSEIEPLFVEKVVTEYQMDDGNTMKMTSTQNILVHSILEELNGRYYDIMYNKKENHLKSE